MTPHNLFLEILAETGVFGLFLFIYPLLLILKKAYQIKQFQILYLIAILVTYFAFNTFSGISRFIYSVFLALSSLILLDYKL
jgi:O-antigen ligase